MSESKPEIRIATPDEVAEYGPPSEAATASGDGASTGVDALESMRRELAELKDRYLRAQAEVLNVTRRLNDERVTAVRNANAAFARDLLVVLDNFERTLASLADRPADDPVAQGVRLVHEQLVKVLRSHGIEPIEAVGKPFDPHLHEALLHEASETTPEGHVVTEMVRGYRMGDRVLRATVVSVARRPAAADAGAPAAGKSEDA